MKSKIMFAPALVAAALLASPPPSSAQAPKKLDGRTVKIGCLAPLTGKGAEWLADYNEKYPDQPAEAYTAYGYDAADALLAAIERAAATNPADNDALRAAIITELKATKDFDGVLGTWSFDENGDTSLTAMSGNVVKDGAFTFDQVIKEQ